MKIAAFDAKQYQRVKKTWNPDTNREETATTFTSQLGVGVTVSEPEEFARLYIRTSQDLKEEFDLDYSTPFFSSACLNDYLNVIEAGKFAKKLVLEVQDLIESVHCSSILLPVAEMPRVTVGGIKCPRESVLTVRFIEGLAPAFSYITALGYVWRHKDTDLEGLEMHIDAFSSKHTTAWDIVRKKTSVKVFYKGDECNPFISCADIIAFLVDNTLAVQRMQLNDEEVRRALDPYSFDTSVWFADRNSLPYYTWKMNKTINLAGYLKRPIVFLAIDRLTTNNPSQEQDEPAEGRRRKPDSLTRRTELYQAALRRAYHEDGCMKLFNPTDDRALIRSGDIFIHAGPDSERIASLLREMADIRVLSGLEAILSEKVDKRLAN